MNRKLSLQNLFNYIYYNKARVNLNLEENLVYCAIAGRVCYSQKLDWNDKRLNTEIVDYLQRLSKWTHYSVFAHVPVEVKVSVMDFVNLKLFNLFKVYYDDNKEVMYINLRHILEAYNTMNKGTIKDIISDFYGLDYFNPKTIKDLKYIQFKNVFYFKINEYRDFFYLENIDRVSSHQIVRHQSLDFNQKSQRYVKLKDVDIPDIVFSSIQSKYDWSIVREYERDFKTSVYFYEKFLDKGMSSEDARGLLGQVSSTNIVISGFSNDIDKFISDRINNKAQSYIRIIASYMKYAKNNWR